MKRTYAVLLGLICLLSGQVLAVNNYLPTDQRIQFMGRTDFDEQHNALLSWSGSAILIKFNGTAISAVLSGLNAKVAFYIDGVKQSSLYTIKTNTGDTVLIANDLAQGDHELIIRQASLVNYAQIHFKGLLVDGQLLDHTKSYRLKLEYYGDSVSDGCAAATPDGCGRDNNLYDDNTSSYTCLLAEKLNAEYNNVSIGGIALCEGAGSVKLGMETRFDKQYPFNSSKLWDFSTYKPDLCIMALGINDYYNPGGITWDEWRARYKALIYKLRQVYGDDTPFLFAAGPMISSRSEPIKNIRLLVAELNAEGIKAYHYVYSFYSYNGHPIASEHVKMASELYDFIVSNNLTTTVKPVRTKPVNRMAYHAEGKYIEIENPDQSPETIAIYSSTGVLKYRQPVEAKHQLIDVSQYQPGLYLLKTSCQHDIDACKILIE
ncbi:MAG: GDSL-type esterase/lipase family protein [Bacteroidota bacterium]|nr:GDSL-type esterase/lipase family protein [Bacteroidota bacterium]